MAHKYVNRAWMTTATTGTGTVTLGSANSGEYYSFAEAGMSSGDTADYVILDGTDVEMGVGTYTSSGTTFSRDTVTSSRISGTAGTSKISLSGSATIFIGVLAAFYSRSREVLTANRDYYVRTDGSNSNDGLANTSGGAFLTIQKALDVVAALDRSIYTVTIHVADGTYTTALTWNGGVGSVPPELVGNTTTPANVVVSVTSNIALKIYDSINVSGIKVTTTTSGDGVYVYRGRVSLSLMDFGTVAANYTHVSAADGSTVSFTGNYTISGGAYAHVHCGRGGVATFFGSHTATLTGTPAFALGFISAAACGSYNFSGPTFSGGATGRRYYMRTGGEINMLSSSLGALPGDSAGVTEKPQTILQNADRTLTSSTATQKLFDTATNGALSLPIGRYTFSCLLYVTTMSATSGNMAFHILGGGSATLGSILYQTDGIDSTTPLDAGTRTGSASVTSASVASVVTAGTGTGMVVRIHGTFTVTAAGTIIPSCALVTANAAVLKAGSHFECRRFADDGTNYSGEWS